MYTTPSPDDILEGIIISLSNDVMPAVANPRAQATVGMAQAIIQALRQQLPVWEACLVDEHNGMTQVLRDAASKLGDAPGEAAESVRKRAETLGARPDYPAPIPQAELMAAHKELSQAIVDTLVDLDTLQRQGNTAADDALAAVRAHLGPRYARDAATLLAGAGMIGRG